MVYKPNPIVEMTSLRDLAESAYQALIPADRMVIDLCCKRIHGALVEKSSTPVINLQYQSLRELVLAVYLVQAYDGSGENCKATMTKTIAAALAGKRRKDTQA